MIDFHSHILPGIDDGSKCLDDTLWMLKSSASQGVETMVATPHFYPWKEYPSDFLERRNSSYNSSLESLKKSENLPNIVLGAEVHYYEGINNSDSVKKLAIENTSYVLIEMPIVKWSSRMLEDLFKLNTQQNLTPIIAHIERYIGSQWGTKNLKLLFESGLPIQVNAGSFLNKSTSRTVLKLLKKGNVHVIGSDCHNRTSRIPNMGEAVSLIQEKLGKQYIDYIYSFSKSILL